MEDKEGLSYDPKRAPNTIIKTHKSLCNFCFLFSFTSQNMFYLFHKIKNPQHPMWVSFCGERGSRIYDVYNLLSYRQI